MNIHQNARLTSHGRAEVVGRVQQGGRAARPTAPLGDRSSRLQTSPRATAPAVVVRVKVLRQRQRPHTAAHGQPSISRIVSAANLMRLHS